MTRIDLNKFKNDFQNGIDINNLSEETQTVLDNVGIKQQDLANIDTNKDGKINGEKELKKLFKAVDQFDNDKSPTSIETLITETPFPSTSGILYEVLKSEYDRNLNRARMQRPDGAATTTKLGGISQLSGKDVNDLAAGKIAEKAEEIAKSAAVASLSLDGDHEVSKEAELAFDIKEGIDKYAQYIEYVDNYVKISGKVPPDIEKVFKGLEKVKNHLGKISHLTNKAGAVVDTIQKIKEFRTAFDPEHPETISKFREGAEAVRKSAEPLLRALKKKAMGSLENISRSGVRMTLVFNYVDLMARGSLKMTDKGSKIVNQIDKKRWGDLEKVDPNPSLTNSNQELPQLPSEFESASDQAKRLAANEKFRATQKKITELETDFSGRRKEAEEKFSQKVWPGIYKEQRPQIIRKYERVIEDMKNNITSDESELPNRHEKFNRYQSNLDLFEKGHSPKEEMSILDSQEKGIRGIHAGKVEGHLGIKLGKHDEDVDKMDVTPYLDAYNRALEKYYKENGLDFKSLDEEVSGEVSKLTNN